MRASEPYRQQRRAKCVEYIRRALASDNPNLAEARRLGKLDDFQANTSAWITALGDVLELRSEAPRRAGKERRSEKESM